ncbi:MULTISPECIES: phosphoenolpyruvate synthase [Methanobrevibacter]|jgi:pyruvate,water dikinase|uniref:phosphoenolpyruvate synthase n=1 Tax=Methanobrevibacter TaxID=2172 RepID=UPI0003348CC0|nr:MULTISPECIES: phosphoenolpyruvate synthase [Methanobrevibacter]AGN17371.1 phosphoenolpyruvate synthase PpsA [Methanobrevibacter sp. AbM4]MCI6774147.1 phosphoenolpyruvate synthase [Methanobrevibacter boviskoreani]MDD6256765.1 phosphoenolpyruvate synthase [Methanobrevibacter boviskoreani]
MVYVAKFEKISKDDIDIAGGKGANLGELTQAGIPVPPGFVITSETYEKFMNDTEINTTIMDILDNVDVNDTKALQEAADEIKSIIVNTPMPMDIKTLIIEAYNQLSESVGEEEADVAVRSSATAEDLPDASFAGQQDTYLHVKGVDEVVEYVQKVWASLFEARAIFYREENNFDHDKVYIAVCVQQMVQAEKSGVMFTVNPSTGEQVAMIESSWGLGEAVVSGDVTPDHYDVNKANNKIENLIVSDKKYMYTNDENGTSIRVNVPEEKRNERVLSDEDLNNLVEMGKTIENHYGQPMDTEWAIEKGRLYLLQARPITTLDNNIEKSDSTADLDVIIKGLGASPGMASGSVKIILDLDELDKIEDGDIMVTTMTTPDMVPAMRKSSGIITDEGGVTCHASIISRELGIPCVVGTGEATNVLNDKQEVTIDGKKGLVYEGLLEAEEEASSNVSNQTVQNVTAPIITVTDVKVNVSMPEAAKRAAATGADGVGLLRAEHMMLGLGVHPKKFITDGKEDELVDKLVNDIVKVADEFYPKPVWYRTMDAPTDEFVTLEGGENEPVEHNPMLGWRGIRRELDEPEIIKCEFKAIKKLHEKGYTNLGIMIPLSQSVSELRKAKELCAEVGLIPQKDVAFGMMVETPAAALTIEDYIEEGIDFVSLGTNDLTQYTLAIDRNNEFVAKNYTEEHPAVMKLIERTIKICVENGVTCSICGQAGSVPHIVEKLVGFGITSVSSNTDAIADVRRTVAKAEKKIILDAARKKL